MKRLSVLLFVIVFISSVLPIGSLVHAATPIAFSGEELLGKPTDTSITINIVPNTTIEYHYQYGTSPGVYTEQTSNWTATANQPHEVVIDGLDPNTKYYYRMQYHAPGDAMDDWVERPEHFFWTQRAPGSTFKFTIIADSHAYYNTQYQQAIQHATNDQPDFHFDLGDTFMTDGDTNQSQVNTEYLAQRNPLYIGGIGHSASIFTMPGNHENEEGWNLDDTFSIAQASIQARKLYYPTPVTDGFYSGNDDPLTAIDAGTYGDQYREDYYAWTWGDALFVVIDPFQYTMQNPYGATAGESNDEVVGGDGWNWTLGLQQYNWLKNVLESSDAKYKFVFSHHMVGGMPSYLYVRGGAQGVPYYEWGGNTWSGTWQFDTKRSGWYAPIHQLFVENGVSAFFHGHDHQYAYEVRDGIVYQCLPRPTTGMDFSYYSESDPYTIKVLPSSGHLRVTVSPTQATVAYVASSGGVNYSYTIEPNETETGILGDVNGDGFVNSTDALIILSCDVGLNTSAFCPMNCGDVNGDGFVNSTDALIILSYDVGMSVPYPVGEPGCPSSVTPCAGCTG
jgi:predicted phosphodiesterase